MNSIRPSTPVLPAASDAMPTREDAEAAVRTLLRWAGDDPAREGLLDTPARVVRSYAELFAGYATDPAALLERTFEEVEGYDEIVLLRDIRLESYCEHHMVPIIGCCHVAYMPAHRVVGVSKLARVVDAYAKRLQIQEKLTVQIADTIDRARHDRTPTFITQRGKTTAVLLDADEYRRLLEVERAAEDAWLHRLADEAEEEGREGSVSLEEMARELAQGDE